MSLAGKLNNLVKSGEDKANHKECFGCLWQQSLSEEDQAAVVNWIRADRSIAQLWQLAQSHDPPYRYSLSALRGHAKHVARN
ncbi:MAG: hypothetical protein EBZ36_17650 [Acidobacteria bacterium]|nr:hypothetical protein [Acidobacteriota bacterium]